jgi:chromosome partitioning protein
MRTVAVIALKGGSGKTTLAAHVALAAHLRGRSTLVADIDPQRSASEIMRARAADGPRVAPMAGADLFAAKLAAVSAGVDLMVVDTAAGAIEDVGQAIVLADLSLLVVRPTLLDLAAMVRTLDVVKRLKKEALIVVNQAPAPRGGVEPPMVKRAMRALDYMKVPVAPTILRFRSAYQVALETGRSAEESTDATAAQEVTRLWRYIETAVFDTGGSTGEAEARAAAEADAPATKKGSAGALP